MPSSGNHTLVTGSGTGIGKATAQLLARRGDEVAVHYRSHKEEAEALVEELSAAGGQAFPVSGDLTLKKDVDTLVQAISAKFPSLEVLVHNAGEYPRRRIEELDEEEFLFTLMTNLWGPYLLTRELLPLLKKAPAAKVVFVSSVLAYTGSSHGADYAASKAGILGLAKSLALELAPTITVNVVVPGSIDTAILAGDSPEKRAERARSIPLGRVGRAEEVAEAIEFLTSPRSSYLTGTALHVNGGLRME